MKAINDILGSKIIRISSADRFNDKKDKEQFGNLLQQKRYYSLCFSSGSNENLSLWYLYSGVDGNGGRIGFTKSVLHQMIKNGNFYFVEYSYENKMPISKETLLKNGENAEIKFYDVLYARPKENFVDLKYNTMTNYNNLSIKEYEKYKAEHRGFNKSLIWYYEKESRLLIKLTGKLAEGISKDKEYAVLWKLTDSQIKRMEIMCAPEVADISRLDEYKYIKKFVFDTSRACLSANSGDIEMNICSKCEYEKKFCIDCDYKTKFCSQCKNNKNNYNEGEKI